MIQIEQFVKNLKRLNVMAIIKTVAERHRFLVSDSIVQNWQQGKTGEGQPLINKFTGKSSYSQSWGAIRQSKGLQIRYYDLRYTGELQDNLRSFVKKVGESINVHTEAGTNATMTKQKDMEKLFGTITTPSETITEQFAKAIEPDLTKEIEVAIFKT
jgi:hypothetical protein